MTANSCTSTLDRHRSCAPEWCRERLPKCCGANRSSLKGPATRLTQRQAWSEGQRIISTRLTSTKTGTSLSRLRKKHRTRQYQLRTVCHRSLQGALGRGEPARTGCGPSPRSARQTRGNKSAPNVGMLAMGRVHATSLAYSRVLQREH